MQNKSRKLILKVFEKEKVYIIKYILSNLNEFTFLSVMHIQSKLKIALSEACKNLQIQILKFIIDILSKNVQINDDTIILHNDKIKIYKL